MFVNENAGRLVDISGSDPQMGSWRHKAFRPSRLPPTTPSLSGAAHRTIADARAALAALDSTARRLPNPTLLRIPALRREAQATSALEGTYAPLSDVLAADEDQPADANLQEVLNYVRAASYAFDWVGEKRPLSVSMLEDIQGVLVKGTQADGPDAGQVRTIQVVIGRRADALPEDIPVHAARFIPSPPGDDLRHDLRELLEWMTTDHRREIDPVVACAMAHYQFETLHPFNDGTGRVGRLLVVLQLHFLGVLHEPTLTISPWFEARRGEYYDRLLAVSTDGDWDGLVRFFARGLHASADSTHRQMLALVEVQRELKDIVRASSLRADTALLLVDFAVANPSFTAKRIAEGLSVSIGRAHALVNQLCDLGILQQFGEGSHGRRYSAPRVIEVLLA